MYEGVVQDLIDELGRLPGVGPKCAQRIAFHLLQSDPQDVTRLISALTQVMEMRKVREYRHPVYGASTVHVYEMGNGGPHAELHVAVQPDLPPTRYGAGGVHHVAFRVPDTAALTAWADDPAILDDIATFLRDAWPARAQPASR